MIWRPIIAQVVTLTELKTSYTIYDLLDVNDALDLSIESERLAMEEARNKRGN